MDHRTPMLDGYVTHLPSPDGSIDRQRRQLLRAAAVRRWRIGRIFTSPELELALSRVESGESDGLLVARVSCLGSSLDEVLAAVERIHAARGRFLSVADGIELDAESGRLAIRLLLALAVT